MGAVRGAAGDASPRSAAVLKAIEAFRAKGLKGAELNRSIESALDKRLPMKTDEDMVRRGAVAQPSGRRAALTPLPMAPQRDDELSHYLLRLAYSRTEDLSRWFLTHETALFRHRFEREGQNGVRFFMNQAGLQYQRVRRPDPPDSLFD